VLLLLLLKTLVEGKVLQGMVVLLAAGDDVEADQVRIVERVRQSVDVAVGGICNMQNAVNFGTYFSTEARGPFLTSPLAPRGEICPLGGMFTLLFTPGVNTLYCLEEWRGKQTISLPGDNITPREQNSPLGTTSPLGPKFAPRGEVKNVLPNREVSFESISIWENANNFIHCKFRTCQNIITNDVTTGL
jgi:hypothetical protein